MRGISEIASLPRRLDHRRRSRVNRRRAVSERVGHPSLGFNSRVPSNADIGSLLVDHTAHSRVHVLGFPQIQCTAVARPASAGVSLEVVHHALGHCFAVTTIWNAWRAHGRQEGATRLVAATLRSLTLQGHSTAARSRSRPGSTAWSVASHLVVYSLSGLGLRFRSSGFPAQDEAKPAWRQRFFTPSTPKGERRPPAYSP